MHSAAIGSASYSCGTYEETKRDGRKFIVQHKIEIAFYV